LWVAALVLSLPKDQPRHKASKINAALAAEGQFSQTQPKAVMLKALPLAPKHLSESFPFPYSLKSDYLQSSI